MYNHACMFMMSILTYMYVFTKFPHPLTPPLKNFWIHTCHAYLSIIGNKIDRGTPADNLPESAVTVHFGKDDRYMYMGKMWKLFYLWGMVLRTSYFKILVFTMNSKKTQFRINDIYTSSLRFSGSYCPFFSHWIWQLREILVKLILYMYF